MVSGAPPQRVPPRSGSVGGADSSGWWPSGLPWTGCLPWLGTAAGIPPAAPVGDANVGALLIWIPPNPTQPQPQPHPCPHAGRSLPQVALPANDGARPPALVARFDGCFRRAQRWRGAGVATPVFSLRRCAGEASWPCPCVQPSRLHVGAPGRARQVRSPNHHHALACWPSTARPAACRPTRRPGPHAFVPAARTVWVLASFSTWCPWWTCVHPPGSASYRCGRWRALAASRVQCKRPRRPTQGLSR